MTSGDLAGRQAGRQVAAGTHGKAPECIQVGSALREEQRTFTARVLKSVQQQQLQLLNAATSRVCTASKLLTRNSSKCWGCCGDCLGCCIGS
jgi:hypothetical protein